MFFQLKLLRIKEDLRALADPERAGILAGFFKTGPGDYGEGDVFLGVSVPAVRAVAKKHTGMPLAGIRKLLNSRLHEVRLAALLVLVEKYRLAGAAGKKEIFGFYISNARRVNNWDLVDLSAAKIVGNYLLDKGEEEKSVLAKLAQSGNLWERRIAIIATFEFIRHNDFGHTFRISELLLGDRHDLIHKAVGWMLREVGKRSQEAEEEFLRKHLKQMPRTALRYAIERFGEKKRRQFLGK